MISSFSHQSFGSDSRVSQSLRNDHCQNILYKAVFEHFKELESIAALLLTSKSFQNSSFGANFLVNFIVDAKSILLVDSILSPSSCFSLQFVPSLHINQSWGRTEQVNRGISNFVGELIKTKYLSASLRALTLNSVTTDVRAFFFGSSSNSWPQLQELSLDTCELEDAVLEFVSKNAIQLRTLNLPCNFAITDAGLQSIARLSNITILDLFSCDRITDAGLEHLSGISTINSLGISSCYEITDSGLKHLSKLTGINSLNAYGCNKINDSGLEHLSTLAFITSLNLGGCFSITDSGLEVISKLPGITSLSLGNCDSITDAGLEIVSKLRNITSLDLSYINGVSDNGLQHLSQLSGITELNLSWCYQITDAGLEHVAKLHRISSLHLCFCGDISGVGLEHLAALSSMTILNLYGCGNISDEAKKKLQTALPNCEIDT